MSEAHSIILAAGRSTRMGQPKALLNYCGTTFIQHLVDIYGRFGPVSVVVNENDRQAIARRVPQARVLVNPEPELGLFSSVHLGVSSLEGQVSFYFVHPVDCPILDESVPAHMLSEARWRPEHTVFVPSLSGRPGHPVLLDPVIQMPLLAQRPDAVFSTVLELFGVCQVPVEEPSVLLNINTPADYDTLVGSSP